MGAPKMGPGRYRPDLESFRASRREVAFSDVSDAIRADYLDGAPDAILQYADGGAHIARYGPVYGLVLGNEDWTERGSAGLAQLESRLYAWWIAESFGLDGETSARMVALGFEVWHLGGGILSWGRSEAGDGFLQVSGETGMELAIDLDAPATFFRYSGADDASGEREDYDALRDWVEAEEYEDRLASDARG